MKTNIGHLEAAAGVAAVIKVLLMMRNKTVVPSLWYKKENENPKLKLKDYGLTVPTSCVAWNIQANQNRTACVNSFGFGGTNAHAIIEQFQSAITAGSSSTKPEFIPPIVVLSAFDKVSLDLSVKYLCSRIQNTNCNISSLSWTSTCRRDHRPKRKAFLAESVDKLVAECQIYVNEKSTYAKYETEKNIVFVFCGVGTTWNQMGQFLLKNRIFENKIDEIDSYLSLKAGWKVKDKFKLTDNSITNDPLLGHIAIFAYQVALACLLKHYGIIPNCIIGQSVGEVAAAHIAGFVDLETAVRIIFHRSEILASVNRGKMAVFKNIDINLIENYCKGTTSLSIAVYSSSVACTVAGEETEIKEMEKELRKTAKEQFRVINLDVQCAYHSKVVEEASKEISTAIGKVTLRKPNVPVVSTVTGELVENGLFGHSDYWARNVRLPVQLCQAVLKASVPHKHTIYLEIGPSPVLAAHVYDIFKQTENISVIASAKPKQESKTIGQALCLLYEFGIDLQWQNVLDSDWTLTELPVYVGQKLKNLYQSQNAKQQLKGSGPVKNTGLSYIHIKNSNDTELDLEAEVNFTATPFVYEHFINGIILLPGAFYAEIGYVIGATLTDKTFDKLSISLEFLLPVRLENSQKVKMQVKTVNRNEEILFHVQNNQRVTCKGKTRTHRPENENKFRQVNMRSLETSIIVSLKTEFHKNELYQRFASIGFAYGESFQMIHHFISNGVESISEVRVPAIILQSVLSMTLHPCILDCLLQTTILTAEDEFFQKIQSEKRIFLPVAIETIRCFRKPVQRMIAYTKLTSMFTFDSTYQLHYNMILLTPEGLPVVDVKNFMTYSKKIGSQAPTDLTYKLTWYESNMSRINDEESTEPNIFLITRGLVESDLKLLKASKIITVFNSQYTCAKSYVSKAFEHLNKITTVKHINVICFFVKGLMTNTNISNSEGILLFYKGISEDCQLLIELLRHVREENLSVPIYIVTECTQMLKNSNNVPVSCNGAAIWGCARSANVEFVTELVLIDLQPSISACKDSLVKFIQNSYLSISDTPTEILIHGDKIYRSEFSKVGRFIKPLNKFTHGFVDTKPAMFFQLRSNVSTNSSDFTLKRLATPENRKIAKDFAKMRVTSVTLPIQSSSLVAKLADPVWRDSNVKDAPVFAIEYKGYILENEDSPSFFKCKTKIDIADENLDERWESIALHPVTVFSEIHVPKKLVFSMKDFKRYRPGMLTLSVIFWKIVKHIPAKSSVFINSTCTSGLQFAILKQMLESKKQCQVHQAHEIQCQMSNGIVVNLNNVDRNVSDILKFEQAVVFEEHVHPQALCALASSKDKRVTVFNISSMFRRAELEKDISQVVKWLKCNAAGIIILTSDSDIEFKEVLYQSLQVKIEDSEDEIEIIPQNLFRKSDAYVITGGLSGLGWEQTKLLAEKGAGIIATLTRKDPSNEVQVAIKQIESATKCKIICLKGDVSDLNTVRNAISTLKDLAPYSAIKGIFHCAGVSRGKPLATISVEEFEFVLRPKVLGTLNLHLVAFEYSLPLDYFVTASSISSLIGSPGQSNYGAANAFIDAFMLWRRRRSLPGQAINWGALEIGMAADPKLADMFIDRGFNLMPVAEIKQCFLASLLQNDTGIVFATMNWDLVSKYFTNQGMRRIKFQFVNVIREMASSVLRAEIDNDDALEFSIEMLKDLDENTRLAKLLFLVKFISSKLIGMDLEALKASSSLAELPFDSMSVVTLVNILQEKTGYKIPDSFVTDTSHTLDNIANHLHENLFT